VASISSGPDGRRTVQFVAADNRRRSIRLDKVPMKTAKEMKLRVERVLAAQTANLSVAE
jgi:hypothetical protein